MDREMFQKYSYSRRILGNAFSWQRCSSLRLPIMDWLGAITSDFGVHCFSGLQRAYLRGRLLGCGGLNGTVAVWLFQLDKSALPGVTAPHSTNSHFLNTIHHLCSVESLILTLKVPRVSVWCTCLTIPNTWFAERLLRLATLNSNLIWDWLLEATLLNPDLCFKRGSKLTK